MSDNTARRRNAAAVRRIFARAGHSSTAAWVRPTLRSAGGVLSEETHRGNQWALAAEVGAPPSPPAGQHPSRVSCHLLSRSVARHEWPEGDRAAATERLQLGAAGQRGGGCGRQRRERRAAKEHAAAVLRYELSIPRRRALGHLTQLTGAQLDLSRSVPNNYTADRIVERSGGLWVLQNKYRQELLRGEPIMTRVMRGEFFEGTQEKAKKKDFCQANKRHVSVASRINSAMRSV